MQILGHHDSAHISPPRGLPAERRTEAAGEAGEPLRTLTTPEIEAWLGRLAQIPDVRDERVSQVAVRLGQGAYVTREAAQRAAAVILDS